MIAQVKLLRMHASSRNQTRNNIIKHLLKPLQSPSFSTSSYWEDRHPVASRISNVGENVFAEFSALAQKHNAINLGQGFPSFGTPDFVKSAAADAIFSENNQYTRPGGHPELVATLAEFYSKKFNRKIDAMSEIVTFNGAQEGIFSILASLCNPGDEVLILEPYFDAYINAASILGIKTTGLPLQFSPERQAAYESNTTTDEFLASELKLDLELLERRITPATRMLVLNTPHNPTGKVFTKTELQGICDILKRHPQVILLSDEVYEFMCYDESFEHERVATYDDMFDRVISLYSAGKTFSCTGWRVGYAICPAHLARPITKMHNSIPFCGATPFEVAVARAFVEAQKNQYFKSLPALLKSKRDLVVSALRLAKLNPIVPQGGYFVCSDASRLLVNGNKKAGAFKSDRDRPDFRVALQLLTRSEGGIATIPTSPFYSEPNKHLAGCMIRIAFCKDDETIKKACDVISTL